MSNQMEESISIHRVNCTVNIVSIISEWIAEDNNILDEKAPQDTKYIHICNQTGTIPASYFLRHKQDTHFRMRYHGLGPLGAKAIALPLKVSWPST